MNKITLYESRSDKAGILGYFTFFLNVGGYTFTQASMAREYQSTIQREYALEELRKEAEKLRKELGIEYKETLVDWNPKPKAEPKSIVFPELGFKITVERI
jgi:hypothetical protein